MATSLPHPTSLSLCNFYLPRSSLSFSAILSTLLFFLLLLLLIPFCLTAPLFLLLFYLSVYLFINSLVFQPSWISDLLTFTSFVFQTYILPDLAAFQSFGFFFHGFRSHLSNKICPSIRPSVRLSVMHFQNRTPGATYSRVSLSVVLTHIKTSVLPFTGLELKVDIFREFEDR